MRLRNLEIAGFRAFAETARLDLDADAIVLVGPNGCGKTSLLDSLLWIVCGSVPRIGDAAALVSMYSSSGGAYGTLELGDGSTSAVVRRAFDGQVSSVAFAAGEEKETRGAAAVAKLCEALWPDALTTSDEAGALTAAVTRSVYLQQDLVRQFIDADTDSDRFEAVSELVGAGRIAEFQVQLDRARNGWTRAKNELDAEAKRVRSSLAALEAKLAELAQDPSSGEELAERWRRWWESASALEVETPALAPSSPQAPQKLDAAIRQLTAIRRDRDRHLAEARQLDAELREAEQEALPDLESLSEILATATKAVEDARAELTLAEAAAAEERRVQVSLREARAELQSLAELALRHLDERCPVCDQHYDQAATRERLERLLGDPSSGTPQGEETASPVAEAAERLRSAEQALAAAAQAFRSAEAVVRAAEVRLQDLTSRLAAFGFTGALDSGALDAVGTQIHRLVNEVELSSQLNSAGEALAVEVARAGESAKRDELQREVESTRARATVLEDDVARREEAGALAVRLLERLREATSEVVKSELQRIDPLLQQIFSTIDPHPAFRAVRLLSGFSGRRGRVNAQLEDRLYGQVTDTPKEVLSSSQLNGLAVSVFLALNLGVRTLPLQTVILDDPLQSLDDVNLLGLVDLLRRIREHRQLIVSTHDPRFGDLLARKLRPVEEGQRTLLYRFHGWSRSGPSLELEEIPPDTAGLRIASSAA